jgi:hypothetical protein
MPPDRGDADAGKSSVVLAASNTPDHDNDTDDNHANAEDISREEDPDEGRDRGGKWRWCFDIGGHPSLAQR